MALPLTIAGNVIGALDVQSTEPNAFTVEDVEVLTTLADQVSVAIQNAQSYEQIQKSLAEAEAISRRYFSETWHQIAQEQKVAGYRYTVTGTMPIEDSGNGSQPGEDHLNKKQVTVPIVIRGRTVGELSVLVPKQEQIRMDHMNLIQAVADRVGVFAENAKAVRPNLPPRGTRAPRSRYFQQDPRHQRPEGNDRNRHQGTTPGR
ncbi:MAG: GAF domain-containing protein [Chloroflexi bacterium]|nr:GAF domain-containing protein [Chloroflexota bacterium]